MKFPKCPCCEKELDIYGGFGSLKGNEEKGKIYKCKNEDCLNYQNNFYTTDNSENLHDGFPC